MTTLIPLAEADPREVEHLLDAAFGADRRARTAYRIRDGMAMIPALSFGAVADGRLIGSIQAWPVELASRRGVAPLVLVGPVAVLPALQRGGVGRLLTARTLAEADARGPFPLVLIGDPEYYGRFFGFSADATGGWSVPGPVERHRLLARGAEGLAREGALGPRRDAIAA